MKLPSLKLPPAHVQPSKLQPVKLTGRQRSIFGFVQGRILARGVPPTVREIGTRFGIRSPNGVVCHLKALEKKGLINRDAALSRGIRVVPFPLAGVGLPYAGMIA